MKILFEKLSDKKVNSFWYHTIMIAEFLLPNGHRLVAETCGAIELRFEENGTKFVGDNAVVEANNLGLDDSFITDHVEDDLIIFMNWFVIVELDSTGALCSDDLALADDYDDAIEMLQEVYNDLSK
jgi:hypothetical protein